MNTQEAKFAFGENWKSYAEMADEERLSESANRLEKLLSPHTLQGKSFVDIGCGSGLHSIAALKLGASSVVGLDLDPLCVETAAALARKLAPLRVEQATFRVASAFDIKPDDAGQFDVVYSWGVLHHTGNMWQAIRNASALAKPNGLFVVALYGKTPYCATWTKIKRWYVKATPEKKQKAEALYVRLFGIYLALRGKRLSTHIGNYKQKRGMDFYHDVRDWIGGYPYESVARNELVDFMSKLGFTSVKENVRRRSGLFGSGCDEYIFRRTGSS